MTTDAPPQVGDVGRGVPSANDELFRLILSPAEVIEVAGGYRRPTEQLEELHRQGFWRARRSRVTGEVVLERAHYHAVCAGTLTTTQSGLADQTPKLRPIR